MTKSVKHNVDIYLIDNQTGPPPPRPSRLPRAFIGDAHRCTRLTFSFLLISSLMFLVAYCFIYIRYWESVCNLKLYAAFGLSLSVCLLNAIASVMGLDFLSKSVVSPYKLFLLHGVMLLSIAIHLFIPVYHFVPDKKIDDTGQNTTAKFPNQYWNCHNTISYCEDVYTLGSLIWSTLILFAILLIAWRTSLCEKPYPVRVQPLTTTSNRLKTLRWTKDNELSSMYTLWNSQKHLNAPYIPHFPPKNSHTNVNENDFRDLDNANVE